MRDDRAILYVHEVAVLAYGAERSGSRDRMVGVEDSVRVVLGLDRPQPRVSLIAKYFPHVVLAMV
jgi:hypothetical protein